MLRKEWTDSAFKGRIGSASSAGAANPEQIHEQQETSADGIQYNPLVRRGQPGEFELEWIEASRRQLPDTLIYAVTDGFNTAQRQRLRRIDLECDVLARQGAALVQVQTVRRASDGELRIFGSGSNHIRPAL